MFVWNMLIKLLSNGLFLPTLPHLCPYQCKCVVFAYIAVNEQLKEQIKDVDAAQSKECSLVLLVLLNLLILLVLLGVYEAELVIVVIGDFDGQD